MSDVVERADAALEGASPGPWTSYGHGVATVVDHCTCGAGGPLGHEISCGLEGPVATETAPDDAHFIAAARTLVPELVAELKDARAEVASWRAVAEENFGVDTPGELDSEIVAVKYSIDIGDNYGVWGCQTLEYLFSMIGIEPGEGLKEAIERIERLHEEAR